MNSTDLARIIAITILCCLVLYPFIPHHKLGFQESSSPAVLTENQKKTLDYINTQVIGTAWGINIPSTGRASGISIGCIGNFFYHDTMMLKDGAPNDTRSYNIKYNLSDNEDNVFYVEQILSSRDQELMQNLGYKISMTKITIIDNNTLKMQVFSADTVSSSEDIYHKCISHTSTPSPLSIKDVGFTHLTQETFPPLSVSDDDFFQHIFLGGKWAFYVRSFGCTNYTVFSKDKESNFGWPSSTHDISLQLAGDTITVMEMLPEELRRPVPGFPTPLTDHRLRMFKIINNDIIAEVRTVDVQLKEKTYDAQDRNHWYKLCGRI